MARNLRELRVRVLAAVSAGFALAAASGACAGESSERDEGGGGSATNAKGGSSGSGGSGGAAGLDSGGAGASGTLGAGGTAINVDGRPFVVAGEERLPEVAERGEASVVHALSGRERQALADRWLERARREHASVAAFSVLSLELLAVGAPAELVERTNRAALDEIEHARLAFAVASRFAGRAFEPGPLDVSKVSLNTDLADIAARATREGCVFETASVALLFAERDLAEDPEVCQVLDRIAEDETRHAELSYALVAWAIASGGARVGEAVAQAFEAIDSLTDGGCMTETTQNVIVPAATALLSARAS